jgi:hypothetical protein
MSTVDPDARAARVGAVLRPVALVGIAVGVLAGPIIAIVDWSNPSVAKDSIAPFLIFLFVSIGAGLLAYYVPGKRSPLTFTDDKGVDRWVKIGRTGGGYGVGDTLPLRYNPKYPERKRAIVVGY